jgi:hypothetical protein
MKTASLAAIALAAFSAQALAATDASRTIVNLGSQGTGFVQVAPALSQPCKFSTVYLPDLSQPNAKGMMAVLLSAQARGALISITYDVDATGVCTANTVSAQ